MPILCELFMAWGIFVPPFRKPHFSGHIIPWPLSNVSHHLQAILCSYLWHLVYSFCPLLGSHQSHATFFSSLTTSVIINMAIYCQYVLASGVSLALSSFGCHKPPVSSLLMCILVPRVHLSLMQTVTCLTIVSHFTLNLFASSYLLSYLLINTLLAAYFSLFAPHCYCPPMFTILYHCIFLHLCTLCSLHTPCLLHARSAMHSYCPMHTHCLLTTLCALVIHSTLVTSSSPIASHCFLVAVRALPTLGTLPSAHGPPHFMHLHHL